jgi:hypothetical protein
MKQYEKATAPRNRNRRNGPRGSARASRDLLRHPDRAGLSLSASGPRRSTTGLRPASVRGSGPEADLPAGRGCARARVLCSAAGGLLRIPRLRLEASASAPWALLLSSLTIESGERGVVERAGKRRRNVESQSADRKRSALFFAQIFSAQRLEADCNWTVTLPSFSGQKGYAGTRNQRHAAYTP